MKPKTFRRQILSVLFLIVCSAASVSAQTTAFTYQGRLADGGNSPNATYDMQFRLFDVASAGQGTQQGSTITNPTVVVTSGNFTVSLDFGAAVFASGADRFLEISLRPAGNMGGYTSLAPRQKLTSAPYSVRSVNSNSADSLSSVCVGCVQDSNVSSLNGGKVTGAVANATTAGSATVANNASQLGKLPPERFVQLDVNGDVSIGTASTGSKLTVAGVIESTAGGIKFPDATAQTTAGLTAVTTDTTLTGNGTTKLPLGIASPLLVRDTDNPAFQPFATIGSSSGALVTVPAGKLLIVEFVTAQQVIPAANVSSGSIQLNVGLATYFMAASSVRPTANSGNWHTITQSTRIYVPAGQTLTVSFDFNASSRFVSVSGYYVNVQ